MSVGFPSQSYDIEKPLFYLGAELGSYLLFLCCIIYILVYHRTKARLASRLAALFAGVIYGAALEWLSMQAFHAYTYDKFLIMIEGVPLMIGVDWSLILFSAMEVSEHLQLPIVVQALFDSLLALNIDFAVDVVAIRIGFWSWANGGEYYGVPLSNFWGWLVVSFSFSICIRLVRYKREHNKAHGRWLKMFFLEGVAAGAAIVAALVASGILLLLWGLISGISISFIIHQKGDSDSLRALISQLVLLGLYLLPAIGAVLWFARGSKRDNPIKIGSIFVGCIHAIFHGYFFVILIITGMWVQYPIFFIVSILMGIIGAAAHIWPYWTDLWLRVWNLKPFTQQVADVEFDDDIDSASHYAALDAGDAAETVSDSSNSQLINTVA